MSFQEVIKMENMNDKHVISKLNEIENLIDDLLEENVLRSSLPNVEARAKFEIIIEKLGRVAGSGYVFHKMLRSQDPQFFNYMASPFIGKPRQEIIEFIKKVFHNKSDIEIYDAYFFNNNAANKEDYLSYLTEIKAGLEEIGINKLTIHYVNENHTTKVLNEVKTIFSSSTFEFRIDCKFQDYLHDRIWIGYTLLNEEDGITFENMVPDPAGAYFGSSFNSVFKKPMFYNPINNDDIKSFLNCLSSI
jgi:hypothetical protein